jgi:hypothetical protein
MTSVELFSHIVDIVTDCAKRLNDSFPDGPDMSFIMTTSSPITKFSEKDLTPQVTAFEAVTGKLETAYNLAKELGSRSPDQEFYKQGITKLVDDIHAVKAAGDHFYNVAVEVLRALPSDSPGAELVRIAYRQAVSLYAELQVFTRKAKPKNSLPSVNKLKSLPKKF